MSCLTYTPLALSHHALSAAYFTPVGTCDSDFELQLMIISIMDAYMSRMASDRVKHQIDAMLDAMPLTKNDPQEQPMD